MATTTIEKLNARAARLKKKLAEKAAQLDPAKLRDLGKRIRRAQRRRRKIVATAARVAGKAVKKTE